MTMRTECVLLLLTLSLGGMFRLVMKILLCIVSRLWWLVLKAVKLSCRLSTVGLHVAG